MTNIDIAKKNYSRGLWTDDMIGTLGKKGKLTATDYETITGKAYSGESSGTVTTAELDAAYKEGVQNA